MDQDLRARFESLLDELHGLKFEITDDFDQDGHRTVLLKRHTIKVAVINKTQIDFDVYADLSEGIYELGELHALTRRILNVKKACLAYDAREMNTTERLYPQNRRGKHTQTSGL